jgi:hypothetical protein
MIQSKARQLQADDVTIEKIVSIFGSQYTKYSL